MRKQSPIIGNFGIPSDLSFWIKVKSKEAIILVNNNNIGFKETEVAMTFNVFFSSIAENLEIPKYKCEDNVND